jgi:hypothetical protein
LQLALQHSALLAHVAAWSLQLAASARLPSIVPMNASPPASTAPLSAGPPPSGCTSPTSDSLPQPMKATFVTAVAEMRHNAAHGSFLMNAILLDERAHEGVDA